MGLYADWILPHLISLSMSNRDLVPYRQRIISAAEGRVLEIGIGSGLNLPYYGPQVREIIGLDPSSRLLAMARRAAEEAAIPVAFTECTAEEISLDDRSVDTAVTTWTLCSIPSGVRALREVRRVLKPGGQLLFVEHGLSPEENVRKWQDRLTPLWKRIGGGCHLNRPIRQMIETAGFKVSHIETGYAKGPKPMTFMYEGHASL